jgi:hypothetical protein
MSVFKMKRPVNESKPVKQDKKYLKKFHCRTASRTALKRQDARPFWQAEGETEMLEDMIWDGKCEQCGSACYLSCGFKTSGHQPRDEISKPPTRRLEA